MVDELKWMEERIEQLPLNNKIYKFMCLLTFRVKKKFTYKEMYLLLSRLNQKTLGEENAKEFAFNRILETYKFNNGVMPEILQ